MEQIHIVSWRKSQKRLDQEHQPHALIDGHITKLNNSESASHRMAMVIIKSSLPGGRIESKTRHLCEVDLVRRGVKASGINRVHSGDLVRCG